MGGGEGGAHLIHNDGNSTAACPVVRGFPAFNALADKNATLPCFTGSIMEQCCVEEVNSGFECNPDWMHPVLFYENQATCSDGVRLGHSEDVLTTTKKGTNPPAAYDRLRAS